MPDNFLVSDERQPERQSLIKRIQNVFRKTEPTQVAQDDITTERPKLDWSQGSVFEISDDRLKKYVDYEEMDTEIVELSSALDVHADFVVSSATDLTDSYSVIFDDETQQDVKKTPKKGQEKASDIIEAMEEDLQLKEKIWFITRNMLLYGDAFYEIVCTPETITKLKFLPPKQVFCNYLKDGSINTEKPYIQKDDTISRVVAEFDPWEIAHFKIGDNDYGVNFSLFSKLRRAYRVERMLEDTLVVTRIAQANRKGVWKIDVTGMGEKEAAKHINKIRLMNQKRWYFSAEGKLKTEKDPLIPMEDIYIPVRKDAPGGDYQMIGGVTHLGEIRDVEHFHNKLFSGTKVPKAYLGFERDVNSKATLYQQNVAFVKMIKRHRYALAEGLRKIYKISWIMAGVNPNSFNWRIRFPEIGTPDEESKWNIENLKANLLSVYRNMGINLPTDWIIRTMFMNLSPAEAEELL